MSDDDQELQRMARQRLTDKNLLLIILVPIIVLLMFVAIALKIAGAHESSVVFLFVIVLLVYLIIAIKVIDYIADYKLRKYKQAQSHSFDKNLDSKQTGEGHNLNSSQEDIGGRDELPPKPPLTSL